MNDMINSISNTLERISAIPFMQPLTSGYIRPVHDNEVFNTPNPWWTVTSTSYQALGMEVDADGPIAIPEMVERAPTLRELWLD